MPVHRVTDEVQATELVAWAAAEEQPLEVLGAGTKRALGRPLQVEHVLDVAALSGIVDYEPSELVLTARPGTALDEIERALADRNQMLAFEPPDWSRLLGPPPEAKQTIGGVVSCNLAGSRRVKSGAVRDHFLGFHGVSGRGEAFKAGGKVVKNVTGYDLCKLVAGSYGTLAVLTEVTVKVVPRPEKVRTVLVLGLDDAAAARALAAGLKSPHDVSGAAHVPAILARHSKVSHVSAAARSVTALRVEGPASSVAHRAASLHRELGTFGETAELHSHNSASFWREMGDLDFLARDTGSVIWRLSVAPMAAPAIVARIAASLDCMALYDWGGGLAWLAVAGAEDGGGAVVRGAVSADAGHATLVRAPAALRAAVPVFHPQAAALAALTARVKESFDPRRILNRGRMAAAL